MPNGRSRALDIYGHLMPHDNDRIHSAVDPVFGNPEDALEDSNGRNGLRPVSMPDFRDSRAEFCLADR